MSLEEKLAAIREGAKKRLPEELRAEMGRATRELRESGILDRAIKVGDGLPGFRLANRAGHTVSSAALLAAGPLVLTVFRGSW